MLRCGPKLGGCQNLNAESTGNSIKSAVIQYWRLRGEHNKFRIHANGSYSGNPGQAPELSKLISVLTTQQKASSSNFTVRAYQMSHVDAPIINVRFFTPVIQRALDPHDLSVDLEQLEACVANSLQFLTVSRAEEMLRLRLENLDFTSLGCDGNIIGMLEYNKTSKKKTARHQRRTKGQDVYFVFQRGRHPGLDARRNILLWLGVLRARGITTGFLFPFVKRNAFVPGKPMT